MKQIPIYRAKKIDSDEYVVGQLSPSGSNHILQVNNDVILWREIDSSTLSIHFPNMIANDSDRLLPNGEKDLRIFASLSEDGKGGNILDAWQKYGGCNMGNVKFTATFTYRGHSDSTLQVRKIIGIQK